MCYSAQVMQNYKQYLRRHPSAQVDYEAFLDLFTRRSQGESLILPKGLTDSFRFSAPQSDIESQCQEIVAAWDAQQVARLHEQLNVQQLRLDGAEVKLSTKPTKKAAEDKRIATKKIGELQTKIGDLDRSDPLPRDNRIFPYAYAPVLSMPGPGQLVIRPHRYLCRPAGMPASVDVEFPGVYNARRSSLGKFWRQQFAFSRGAIYLASFFENVSLNDAEQRQLRPGELPQSAIIEFTPADGSWLPMACLWSHWRAPGSHDLLSFAIITDEPNPEVRAHGHDRTPISIAEEDVVPWLTNVDGANGARYDQFLEVKQRPYYNPKLRSR